MSRTPAPPRPDGRWRPATAQPPAGMEAALHGWLTETGSLTERLVQHWPDLAVQLLQEGPGTLRPDEARRLALGPGTPAWRRTVQLVGGGAVRLRAHTVVPHWRAGHPWAAVAALGTQPLGRLLFGQPEVERSGFEWACVAGAQGAPAWARRCVYTRAGRPLLLTETFVAVTGPG